MNNLLTGLYSKLSGSALSSAVGGRVYLDRAPDGCEMPYVVFYVVAGTPDKTFTEAYTDTLVQFSLFSASTSAAEISTMYANLMTLYDECSMTITGSTLVWCRLQNLTTMVEDITTPEGAATVKHWAVDFEIRTSKN